MNLEQENYKNLTPFKFWTLTNFPFIEQTFDSLTNYELLCKLGEYLNNLEYNQNAVQTNMTNLYSYVSDYFKNLDVTEDINNKLDELASDGTLTNLISNYINPFINEQNNKINLQNNKINLQDNKIAIIDSKVNAATSGSPAGVYATLAELQSADPDHSKIYLVLEDGEWYFWNTETEQWKNGGVYQASEYNKNIIIIASVGEARLDIDNHNLILDQVYVLNNSGIKNLSGIYPYTFNANLQLISYENETISFKSFNAIDLNLENVIGQLYGNKLLLFNCDSNTYDCDTKNVKSGFNIIAGDINYNTSNKKITINPLQGQKFFALIPTKNNSRLYETSEIIEIDCSELGSCFTLLYRVYSDDFVVVNNENLRFQNNNIPIFSIYNNVMYPFIEPHNLKINNTNYYNTIINVNIDTAIKYSINDMIQKLNDPSKTTKIVLVGDSITQGVGGTNFSQNGETIIEGLSYKRNTNGYCWANLFKNYIESNYNANVINNGCTGTNTDFLVQHLTTLIPSDSDIVIISYGTNNRNNNYETAYTKILNHFDSVIAYCEQNDIKYIINSPIPSTQIDEEIDSRLCNIFKIANIIKTVASIHKIEYNNMYNLIYYYCLEKNINWDDYISTDHIHPNDNGYWVIFQMLLKGLGLAPSYISVPHP